MSSTQNTTSRQYRNAEWLEAQYIEKDRTQAEIASICGCCPSTISKWLDKFDIEKTEVAQFGLQTDGYEQWKCEAGPGKADTVTVHRLMATLKVDDLSELDGKEVHHKSGVEWHNTLDNVEILIPSEHRQRHISGK
ncbi:helix-turn-helix domain-containing protein [Halorubrum xinjiangense]|uniref:helix-turn-helix domain-containing protein n=1 Tax=Halorubrum xinjiangense TaxID=261291 RepID=UPI00122DA8D7|nr:helix-turn-helix domain-containing protein [Halorubrum xinjiangense]